VHAERWDKAALDPTLEITVENIYEDERMVLVVSQMARRML